MAKEREMNPGPNIARAVRWLIVALGILIVAAMWVAVWIAIRSLK